MGRVLDICASLLALTALSPLLVLVALTLRFTGEGEIFFVQTRVSRGQGVFSLLKFATMLKDSPNIGSGTVTLKDDPRILPLGHFLRATKINELPQLLNVLRGDMSIIGPRPQTARCFEAFPDEHRDAIASVRPGLSGLGSIVFRDEESLLANDSNNLAFYDDVIAPYKARLEVWYVEHKSLGLDLFLILATLVVVLKPKSKIVWKMLGDLPRPPSSLSELMPEA